MASVVAAFMMFAAGAATLNSRTATRACRPYCARGAMTVPLRGRERHFFARRGRGKDYLRPGEVKN